MSSEWLACSGIVFVGRHLFVQTIAPKKFAVGDKVKAGAWEDEGKIVAVHADGTYDVAYLKIAQEYADGTYDVDYILGDDDLKNLNAQEISLDRFRSD